MPESIVLVVAGTVGNTKPAPNTALNVPRTLLSFQPWPLTDGIGNRARRVRQSRSSAESALPTSTYRAIGPDGKKLSQGDKLLVRMFFLSYGSRVET